MPLADSCGAVGHRNTFAHQIKIFLWNKLIYFKYSTRVTDIYIYRESSGDEQHFTYTDVLTMNNNPDEHAPHAPVDVDLRTFNCLAQYIIETTGDEQWASPFHRESTFVRFCLAGITFDGLDGAEASLTVDPTRPRTRCEDSPFTVTRNFDSLIGLTRNLPFNTALPFFPLPPFKETLKRSNHLKAPIRPRVRFFLIYTTCLPLTSDWYDRGRTMLFMSTCHPYLIW